ncbi:hypothetical protein [Streptomyces sp. NBC_01431]|uniref:hypothetical protein n=1 Tax=Streptomyces sp. NBC_01431 TaxID=2903863 RepID=UPI002E3579CD|nr:hypothetical protein [Streptomyces sp. NBC_01431]
MGAIRIASAALTGAAALSLAAPVAMAAGTSTNASNTTSFAFSVTPSMSAPGGQVTLNVTGCAGTATASSGVFNTVSIPPDSSRNATVDVNAKRGASYTVTFACGSQRATSQLTIIGGSQPTISSTLRPPSTPTTTAPTTPLGVRGGLGGSVDTAGTWEMAAGAALVAAAGGGALFYLRRRVARRQRW